MKFIRFSRPIWYFSAAFSVLFLLPVLFSAKSRTPVTAVTISRGSAFTETDSPKNRGVDGDAREPGQALWPQGAFAQAPIAFTDSFESGRNNSNLEGYGDPRTGPTINATLHQEATARVFSAWGPGVAPSFMSNGSQYQLFGVRVQGPILSGRGIARDRNGNPVASLNQPNLLTAGRGFLPETDTQPIRNQRRTATSGGGVTTDAVSQESRKDEESSSQSEAESADSPLVYQRGDFEFRRADALRTDVSIMRVRNGSVIAKATDVSARERLTSFIGAEKEESWNSFVGELFLIAVAPELVGVSSEGQFLIKDLDSASFLNVVEILPQDAISAVNDLPISQFGIEDLPDVLLNQVVSIDFTRDGTAQRASARLER